VGENSFANIVLLRNPEGKRPLGRPKRRWEVSIKMNPNEAAFPGVKRPGREADHLPPTSAEVKKMWIYTSTFSYAAFMA
jgi:hypothetical protein